MKLGLGCCEWFDVINMPSETYTSCVRFQKALLVSHRAQMAAHVTLPPRGECSHYCCVVWQLNMETLFALVKYFLVCPLFFLLLPCTLIGSTKSSKIEWLSQKWKFIVPPQPTRLVNNGTFTKNPKPTAPTFIPLPVPLLYAKTAAKIHPKQSPFLLIETFQLSVNIVYFGEAGANSRLRGKNSPNAVGKCIYAIKLLSLFSTFFMIIKGLKYFTRH